MPVPDLTTLSLAQIAALAAEQRLPPVATWHPQRCGHSDMRIDREGKWHHEGRPITRPELVKLFASILRREPDGRHVLVTPVEMLDIDVEDAPLLAIELRSEGLGRERQIAFRINSDELVIAGAAHPLRIAATDAGPRPYLLVREGIEARIERALYYELIELALGEEDDPPGLWSEGVFFALEPA
jgi:hypothetical protein